VLAQTRPPDRLLVINNSSTDGTVEMLEKKKVGYVTQPNLGSAGGWARAIEEAKRGGFDAVWLMDDDGYPGAEALALLEASLTGDVGCVSSVVLRENDPEHFVFPFPKLDGAGYPVVLARRRKMHSLAELRSETKGDLYPFAHLFNGALVSVETARAIGNVSPDYFMSGDEIDYFMRLQRRGPIYSHLRAHHYHPDVTTRPLTPPKFYYYLKNTIILNRLYFNKKTMRHLGAIAAVLARTARRNSPAAALGYLVGPNARVLWKAVIRGLGGKLGPDFDA
jgi:GT2 family glycosyltransferase